jgi:DNA polymerase-4
MQINRKIIHIDMDAFYAAIEQRDNPELRGKPVVVGGDPNSRSVVSTASYEARKFGIRSAMPTAHAKKLCPHAIFVHPNFRKYQEASVSIMNILRQHTDLVEPASLDEAYLDVTRHKLGIQDPVMIASLIKQNIYAVTHLTASAGVAPNLFLAKVASDMNKPDGLTVVREEDIPDFLENLSVRKIPGVGPVMEEELKKRGILTCGQLASVKKDVLVRNFGKTGLFLYERARGRDSRQVEPDTLSKQYSREETFDKDTKDKGFLKEKLREIADDIFQGLRREERMGRTVVLKVKYHDFELITRSKTLAAAPATSREIYETACDLLEGKTLAGTKAVRLIGLGISGLDLPEKEKKQERQKELF